jgi:hypothetical protein
MTGDLAQLERQLADRPFGELQLSVRHFPRKDHFNVLPPAVATGLRSLFDSA